MTIHDCEIDYHLFWSKKLEAWLIDEIINEWLMRSKREIAKNRVSEFKLLTYDCSRLKRLYRADEAKIDDYRDRKKTCSSETQISSDEDEKEDWFFCDYFRDIEVVSKECRTLSNYIIEKEFKIENVKVILWRHSKILW